MSQSESSKGARPIPVGELIGRLIARTPEGAPELRRPKEKAPFPPVVPKYGVVRTGRFARTGSGSPSEDPGRISYFVEILTTEGPEQIWGSDLKRALDESETHPQPGAIIGVQRIGYQLLKVKGQPLPFKRTRWRIERIEYFAQAALEARRARDTQLRGRDTRAPAEAPKPNSTALARAAAFADRSMHHPHDRQAFIEALTERLTQRARFGSLPTQTRDDHDPPTR